MTNLGDRRWLFCVVNSYKIMRNIDIILRQYGIDERMAMNILQSAGGIISDNCVCWDDVNEQDQYWAIEWLKMHFNPENGHQMNLFQRL